MALADNMRSLWQFSFLRQKKLNAVSLVILITVLAILFAITPKSLVYAAGGIGSGGTGGSGSGGAQTRYGWGWYNYQTNGGITPQGFRNGTTWSSVRNLCTAAGADRVIAFIVLTQSGTDASKGVVYDYKSSWDNFQGHRGNSGGNWLPTSTAYGYFQSLADNGVDTTGYTWGDNVAWFCYNSIQPSWSITPTASVSSTSVIPGTTITWTHKVTNSGPTATNKIVDYNFKNNSGFSNNSTGGSGTLSSGSANGASKTFTSTHVPGINDIGKTFCRVTEAKPKSVSNSGLIASSPSCVTVTQPPWSITPAISVNSTSVLPGATITWTHRVTNSGPSATNKVVNYNYKNSSGFSNNSTGGSGTLPSGSSNGASRTFTSTFTPGFGDIGKSFCRVTEAQPKSSSDNGLIASSQSCVIVNRPADVCRPMLISAPNATTYPAKSHTAPNGTRYSAPAKTVSYTVSTSVQSWGPFTTARLIDATSNHTTGDTYTVTFRETSNHVTGYTDNYVNDTTRPIRGPAVPPATQGPIIGYHQKYSSTTTNYGGPATWTSSIGPCYDYMLTTNLNNFANKLEPDSVISINPTINSASWTQSNYRSFWNVYGTHSKSKPSKWQITKMVIAPNNPLPASVATRNSATAPCSNFDPTGITTCTAQATGNSTVFSTGGVPSPSTNLNFSIPDSPAGTKICFAFSLYPTQSDPSNTTSSWGAGDLWSHAAFNPSSNCIIIVKKPKTQIWGGDLWVGKIGANNSKISSSTSVKNVSGNNRIFGSWVEYGIFSPSTIAGTASGAAFAGSTGLQYDNQVCSYSTLTFTNAGNATCTNATSKGMYATSRVIPDIEANFPGAGKVITTNTIVVNALHN